MAISLSKKQIQEGWQIVKFGVIARNISERVDPLTTDLEVYVGLEHLDPQSLRITRQGIPTDVKGQKLRVRPGQIIFGKRRAYQKKLAVADFDGICSAHAMVLESVPGKIIPELLPFFMQSDMFMDRAVAISEGSLSPTIKWKTLAIQEFPLPPIERQKEILEVFEKLDNCVNLVEQALIKAEVFYKYTIYALINYGPTKNKMKTVPVEWEEKKFIEFATLQRGFDLPNQDRKKGEYSIFASTKIVGTHCNYMVEAPGVVTGRSGTIGQVAYAEEKFWPLNTALFVKDFHGNIPKFVKYFIESFHVERFATGSGVPTLNRNIVHKEKIRIPSINEQLTIVDILSKIDKVIEIIQLRKQNYLALRCRIFLSLFGSGE